MLYKIKVDSIRENPYQPRKNMDGESIKLLAQEIKKMGLWSSPLRGRERDGHIELCFGHRRLAAIRHLGWTEVEIDIVDLSDVEMALQALIENLQREGLDEVERADGILKYMELKTGTENPSGLPLSERRPWITARRELAAILGYKDDQQINIYLKIAAWEEEEKEPIRNRKIAAQTACELKRIAGIQAIHVGAERGIKFDTVKKISKEVEKIANLQTKDKVKAQIATGKVFSPEEVIEASRRIQGALSRKTYVPPDLIQVIGGWTERAIRWADELEQVAPYIEYIDSHKTAAAMWREAVTNLIDKLKKLM
jgi:ParB-like chromosome segregation protein Spo0J